MGTAGAYAGQSFSFNYSFVDSASPESFFASDLANSDITVYSRSGSSTGAGASIATTPTRSGSLFTITLTTSEMAGDEVILQCSKSGMISETISIALEPTPADISEVTQSAVSGISDFQGSGGGGSGGATAAEIYTYFTDGSREDVFKATGFATVNPDNSSIASILADTNELQQNQGDWATATGFSTHDQTDVVNAMLFSANDFKADVSGLSTFNPASDTVIVGTNNDKTGYVLTQAFPSNFSNLIIGTGGDAGKVTTSNPAAGSGSAHTAQDVANLILTTPANKLATDSSGHVTAENMRGTDGANTTAPDNASISAILADTNELQGNQGDWATATGFSTHSATDVRNALQAVSSDFKANVSGLATQSSVNTVDSNVDAIKAKTDQLAFTVANQVDANALTGGGSGGGGGDDAATIYNYFVAGSREDVFKADVSGLSTFDPSTDEVTTDTASRNASKANVSGLSTFNPASQTVTTDAASRNASKADVSGLSTFDASSETVTTDTASRNASKADVSSLATSAQVAGLNDFDPASDTIQITTDQMRAIADEVLKRGVSNTEDSADAHSMAAIILGILESQRTGASWTIRKTDGSTFATKTLSLDSGANPVTGVT